MQRRQTAILNGQFRSATKQPSEFIKFAMSDDMSTWYVILSGFTGDKNEYVGGEYVVRIYLPPGFPFKPPHFYFMTPQGLYECEKKVCISIGEFHSDQYRAALGVAGFCEQLVSGLIGWREMGGGISIIQTTENAKKKMAEESAGYNAAHNQYFMDLVNSAYAGYSSKWDLATIPRPLAVKLGLIKNDEPEAPQ